MQPGPAPAYCVTMGDENADSTRERVITTAIDVFAAKGYASTLLTDITALLGVTRSPIYYHFKDKRGLYAAAYERWEHSFSTSMDAILTSGAPIISIYREILRCCVLSYRHYEPNFFVGIDTHPELADIWERYNRVVKNTYQREVDITQRAIEHGELPGEASPRTAVNLLWVIYDGLRAGMGRCVGTLTPQDVEPLIEVQLKSIECLF